MSTDYPRPPSPAPKRRWIILLATLAGMGGTAAMGRWQLGRAAEKEALQAEMDSRARLPALSAAELARTEAQAPSQYYRLAHVSGHWLAAATVYLDNRPMDGRAGFIVVTPLLLGPGDAVAVQRGWVPRDALERTRLPQVDTPAGLVTLEARVAPPPSKLMAFGPEQPGTIRQNLDLAAYARELQALVPQPAPAPALRPYSLVQLSPADAQDSLLRHWPAPAVNVGTHYGYAAQWFGMCALMAGLYVWFQLIRPQLGARR